MEKLHSIIKIDSIREFKNSDKVTETATRYYISSLSADAEVFQKAYVHIGELKINSIGLWM